MKRLIILIMIAAGLTAQGQNTLSLTGGSGHPGDTVTVTLSMTNSATITALQTFIPLGDQLTYVVGSATLTSRSNGHQLTATVLRDTLRLYSYSLSLNSYSGTSGALLTFRVVLGPEPGNYTLTPTQIVLSSTSGTALGVSATNGTVTVLSPKVQITPASLNYGHVPIRSGYTRTVTVRNIGNEPLTLTSVTFSDASLSANTTTATLAANAQQSITLTYNPTVAGATTMTTVFHTNAQVGDSVVTIAADPYSVNELRPLNVSGYTDSVVTVELRMNNMDSIVGLQTVIKLPSALTYVAGSFAADATRAPEYTATAGLQGDTLTLLLTNLTGTPIHDADGVVARFQLRLHGYGSHTLWLMNTALSDASGTNVLSAVYTGTVSIYSPYLSCSSSMDFGNTPVTETATAALLVRNTGNASLMIDRVVFTQSGWQLLNTLPMTVANNGRDTLRVSFSGTVEGNHSAEMLLYTNDPRNDLKRIVLTAQRYEPNALYMAGHAEASAALPEVDIMLDNYSDVTALQMDVRYPHNHFTLNPSDITLTSRSNGHIVSAARLDDSTLRVLMLSMQNSPFVGHSGAVARMQLHAHDSLSTQSYPLMLLNITSGCTDGVDRLSSIQSVGWFATREVHDTTYIPDTTLTPVIVYDTTVQDTLIYNYIQQDSILYTYINRDTVVFNVTQVDSIIYNVINRDTVVYNITQVDTTVYNVINRDTVVYNISYIDTVIYDSTLMPITVFDTIYDTIYLTVHDTIYDTIYIPQDGIDGVEAVPVKMYQQNGRIVVDDPQGREAEIYDAVGRRLAVRRRGEVPEFEVPASGVYLVKVEGLPARRVVVIR